VRRQCNRACYRTRRSAIPKRHSGGTSSASSVQRLGDLPQRTARRPSLPTPGRNELRLVRSAVRRSTPADGAEATPPYTWEGRAPPRPFSGSAIYPSGRRRGHPFLHLGGTSSASSVQRLGDLPQRTARRPSLPSRNQRMLVPLTLPK
jgi:hypothetical protein